MSACIDECGGDGEHIMLEIRQSGHVSVMHRCTACGLVWNEDAQDPEGALASFGWPRTTLDDGGGR